jgi:hypothetical protein
LGCISLGLLNWRFGMRPILRQSPLIHSCPIVKETTMTKIKAGITAGAILVLAAFAANPAAARIECRGNFQVSKYGLIATPYCEEEQIAKVAQSYGSRVTAAEVHNNALTKVYLCQTIGYDQRLKGSCAGYSPDNFGPR